MTVALTVPKDWTEVTPAWLTSALATHHPDAVVEAVTAGVGV